MINGLPRILMIRLSAIGDVVRVLPALHALRKAHPSAQIDWAVEAKSAGIVEGHPDLDQMLVFERPEEFRPGVRAFREFCRQIRANRYDSVVDFHGILKSGLIAASSRAEDRYGFARPRSQEASWLFTNRRVKLPSQTLNRVEENMLLAEALGAETRPIEALVHVPPDVQEEVDEYIDRVFAGGKLVVAMHVPVDRPEKRWPAQYFAALADMLLSDGRFDVVLTWGPGQFPEVESVLSRTRHHPHIAPQTADLKHYAWLVHQADLYFGCDTGPMHIASAMGTPVVAVFGGTDPAKHAPMHQPSEVLYVRPEEGGSAHDRLAAVTPDMAYDACVRVVSRQGQR